MTDGVDPGAPSAAGPGGTAGPARAQQAKHDVSAALDLSSATWTRLRDKAGTEHGPVEYAFVRHTDGVTYVVLRSVPGGGTHEAGGHHRGRYDGRHDTEPGDGHAAPAPTVLVFTPSEWDAFLAGVRDGEFDRPPE
ncbi:DUF397 domain-containing protein [Prauserella alba]|uniref:DUF397 domain-containing protein n=1 Tax=Prauserella alba TaxID=176898 RepID=A0ABN1VC44_9PSEU|nr:DUF397 domain-containing protein [Prauserella alba]MCP2179045.1 protein of unknown function (DUF397) [Prauserella alba]